MHIHNISALFLTFFTSTAATVHAQQSLGASRPDHSQIQLNVVVSPKSGKPVPGLLQQDMTVLVDNAPQSLTSFKAVSSGEATVAATLVIDALNLGFTEVAREQGEIEKFLRADGGHLALPTTIQVFTEKGFSSLGGPTRDGNVLAKSVAGYTFSLRTIRRSEGFYGAADRFSISLNGLSQLAELEGTRPGRKMLLWVSPGWPLLSGPGVELDAKQQKGLFGSIVNLSTRLREASITLYSIDPLGVEESVGRTFYYQNFIKGVSKPEQVAVGDLSLQVLAVQSGGLALSSTGVSQLLSRCTQDAEAYYSLSFAALPGDRPNEYHRIDIKVAEPGMVARTSQGYYSQP